MKIFITAIIAAMALVAGYDVFRFVTADVSANAESAPRAAEGFPALDAACEVVENPEAARDLIANAIDGLDAGLPEWNELDPHPSNKDLRLSPNIIQVAQGWITAGRSNRAYNQHGYERWKRGYRVSFPLPLSRVTFAQDEVYGAIVLNTQTGAQLKSRQPGSPSDTYALYIGAAWKYVAFTPAVAPICWYYQDASIIMPAAPPADSQTPTPIPTPEPTANPCIVPGRGWQC